MALCKQSEGDNTDWEDARKIELFLTFYQVKDSNALFLIAIISILY